MDVDHAMDADNHAMDADHATDAELAVMVKEQFKVTPQTLFFLL